MTSRSGPPGPGFREDGSRQGDARSDVADFRQDVKGQKPVVYRSEITGVALDPRIISGVRDPETGKVKHFNAPMLTAEEQAQAVQALREAMEANQVRYPQFAQTLINDPSKIWLMAEIQMMLSPQPNEASYDFTGELSEAITLETGARNRYNFETSHNETQQLFWHDYGSQFKNEERSLLIDSLAQLEATGADRVAALAIAWADKHDMQDEENKAQLLLNTFQWAYAEKQSELGSEGLLGSIGDLLDAPQEFIEQNVVSPLINAGVGLLSGAEEAARRKALTPGQQVAYQLGLSPTNPNDDAAWYKPWEWSWWQAVSGLVDANIEIGADPINVLAGVGAASKAIKTIPLAAKATRAGRATMAARALLPRSFTGTTRQVFGGRTARVLYALRSKSLDDLLEGTLKNGVAEDALRLIKSDNPSRLARTYPVFSRMPDEMYRTIQEAVETPEELVSVFRQTNLHEVINSGKSLDDLEKGAREAWVAARGYLDDSHEVFSPEQIAQMRRLRNFEATAATALDDRTARLTMDSWANDISDTDRVLGNIDVGDQVLTVKVGEFQSRASKVLGSGETRKIWYATDDSGRILGGYDGTHLLRDPSVAGAGFMSRLLRISDEAGESFLPRLMERAESTKINSFTEEGAGFLRRAIDERLQQIDDINPQRLVAEQNIPRSVRLEAAKRQLALDNFNATADRAFIISDVPQKVKKVFSWNRALQRIEGTGRGATAARRVIARVTPGRPDDVIDLFQTRKGSLQLQNLFEHFGMRQEKIDDLINEFRDLDLGARQDWFWDRGMRELGRETKVPALEYNLVQFYKGAGVRNFAGAGTDLWVDAAGKAHRMPVLPSQMTARMPVPVDEIREIAKRSASIGNRSKVSQALGFNGRGLGATKSKRAQNMRSLRTQLGDDAVDMTDDELFQMAYSVVSPGTGLDGRGWAAAKMMPAAGTVFNKLHRAFTKSMLLLRPIQWMWRVAILEEPIRAHLYNMPSMYSNPLQYMAAAREAHYITNLTKWAEANSVWGQDIYRTLTKSAGKDEILKRLDDVGLKADILGDVDLKALTLPALKDRVANFIQDATYGRTRINKLNPIKKVPWAVKNKSRNIAKAEKALDKFGLPKTFDFLEDAAEINLNLVQQYLGEAVGASSRRMYQWDVAQTPAEAYTYGQVYGAKLIEMVEDVYGHMAIRRVAQRLRGLDPDAGFDANAVLNSSRWELMRHDLGRRFPDAPNDLALAERYMDEIVAPEVEHLFKPFINSLDADEAADLLDDFVRTRTIDTVIEGVPVKATLTGSNYGGGVRQMGDFVRNTKDNPAVLFPEQLYAPSLDPRFMAHDDVNFVKRISDWTLQTFGEKATQNLNRRPAWLHEYGRWLKNYQGVGVPEEVARRLAMDQANKMVNYVFFNMDEAPYYAAKLNQFLPFFGATYEVLGTWAYKMPVAVGGTWPVGIAEFGRKFDRVMDALVNVGLVTREEQQGEPGEDKRVTYVMNLVPPSSDTASPNQFGRFLQGAGFAAVRTLEESVGTILGLQAGLGLREDGLRLAVGHPLNPTDYGMLSYAQTDIGVNPAVNIAISALAAVIPAATAPERTASRGGESLADVADRMDVDINELIRKNRDIFVDTPDFGSTELYNSLLAGEIDVTDLELPKGTTLNVPGSSLWEAFEDTFRPFGAVDSPQDFMLNYLPGVVRWGLNGLALQNQPTDEFWKDTDLGGIFGGMLPATNQAQVASQVSEAFMYVEAHETVGGKGPFARIQEKTDRLNALPDDAFAQRNALRSEIQLDTEAFLQKVQATASESFFLRSFIGQLLPTAPGHVRAEQAILQSYWDTLDYSDSIKTGEGEMPRLVNFKSMEQVEEYYEQLAAWLSDPTGDAARAAFNENTPQLMAYLTPKTFYKEPVPDISSFEDYQKQIESGEREPAPLHVTMWRARSSAIQADYYNEYIATFGSDPQEAAANALNNRQQFQDLSDERNGAYQALEMWDDMHGSVYDAWRQENYQDTETWAQDQLNDKLNTVRDNLAILFELEDDLEIELDLGGIADLNSSVRGAIAEISNAIREYESLTEETGTKNAYESALNRYFEEVYIPYSEQISDLYDQLPEAADSEKQSLIYEQIKFVKNQFAQSDVFFDDDTTTPFPNPLEYSWQGKGEEEQEVKRQQWLTRPLEWIDQDQTVRIVEASPQMAEYLPTADSEFDIYREFTLAKIEIDEMFEANEITRSQRNKGMKNLDQQLQERLILQGRHKEVEFMNMTPFEKLELSGTLPEELGIFGDKVRYYKQVLDENEESAGTVKGRLFTAPLYDMVEEAFYADPNMRSVIQTLGVNLQDDDTLDNFLPWLFFGYTGER